MLVFVVVSWWRVVGVNIFQCFQALEYFLMICFDCCYFLRLLVNLVSLCCQLFVNSFYLVVVLINQICPNCCTIPFFFKFRNPL